MKIIGTMSGTSADGLDIALCEITGAPPKLEAKIIASAMLPYPSAIRDAILAACQLETSNVQVLGELNFSLAYAMAQGINKFITDNAQYGEIDLIGSHGQTVWHNVDENGLVTSTLQIASSSVIAEETGITTINNFRERDVAAGGQGAPLTSYVDWLLMRDAEQWRAVQNIGGMGNVTLLPPLTEHNTKILAFDTGPGNALIDVAVYALTDGELICDLDGSLAKAGTVNRAWLEELLAHPYYQRKPPKTTGRELFGTDLGLKYVEEGKSRQLSEQDIIATLTALTAHSIADAYQRFISSSIGQVIIGGGGGNNPALMEMLSQLLYPTPVISHEALGLDSDFKEALVFAVLAYETWHNRIGALPEQTGANHATVLGQITPGNNYGALIERTWLNHAD
jgi:anhydro-N-acetylmuramic acid kinase